VMKVSYPRRRRNPKVCSLFSAKKRMNRYLTNRNRMMLPFVNITGKYNRFILSD
jgi:hypothetical protein